MSLLLVKGYFFVTQIKVDGSNHNCTIKESPVKGRLTFCCISWGPWAFLTQSPSPFSSELDRGESIELLVFLLIGLDRDSGLSRSHVVPLMIEEPSTMPLFLLQSPLHPVPLNAFPQKLGATMAKFIPISHLFFQQVPLLLQ